MAVPRLRAAPPPPARAPAREPQNTATDEFDRIIVDLMWLPIQIAVKVQPGRPRVDTKGRKWRGGTCRIVVVRCTRNGVQGKAGDDKEVCTDHGSGSGDWGHRASGWD